MVSLFVGNLAFRTNEDEIRALFEQYGTVERVKLVTDRESGRSRGFAFVDMADADAAQNAISQLNGAELDGRALRVNAAEPRAEGGQRPDSGYGSRRRQPDRNREGRW